MKCEHNDGLSCKDYEVVEEGKTFWCMDDFYPTEPKPSEQRPSSAGNPRSQSSHSCTAFTANSKRNSASKSASCQNKTKHSSSCKVNKIRSCMSSEPMKKQTKNKNCKRTASAGSKKCASKSLQQITNEQSTRTNSQLSMKGCGSQPKLNNKECVLILPPTERKSNSGSLNKNCSETAVAKSSRGSCKICSKRKSSQCSASSNASRQLLVKSGCGDQGPQDTLTLKVCIDKPDGDEDEVTPKIVLDIRKSSNGTDSASEQSKSIKIVFQIINNNNNNDSCSQQSSPELSFGGDQDLDCCCCNR